MSAAIEGSIKKTMNSLDIFTDWYIPADDPTQGYVYPGPVRIKENGTLIQAAMSLADSCRERDSEEFLVRNGERIFRGHRIETVEGWVYSLRRVPNLVPEFGRLGLDKGIQAMMLHRKLNAGGLVLVCGETGQGKSTTCAAFIRARMEKYASFCLTLENPPELPLHGMHGAGGMCIQTDVKSGEFGDALRGAVRCYPSQGNSILFVGEIRDPETAGEALRIAINGHLVVTSLHGGDIISSMKHLMTLALSYKNMSETEARSVFSSAFRLVIHQRLRDSSDGFKRLEAKALFSASHSSPVANRIRQGNVDGLSTDIQQQETLISLNQVDRIMELWGNGTQDRG